MNKLLVLGIGLVLLAGPAAGQGMPTAEEIDKAIEQAIEQLPTVTAEAEEAAGKLGVTITHKDLPTDPVEMVTRMPNLPPQVAQNTGMIKSYLPQAMPYLAKHLEMIGQLTTEHPLKLGSTTIPAGDYDFGLVMVKGEYQPEALVIKGEKLAKPVYVQLQTKKTPDTFPNLKLKLQAKGDKVWVLLGWGQTISKSASLQVKK